MLVLSLQLRELVLGGCAMAGSARWARDIKDVQEVISSLIFCGGGWCLFVLLFVTSSFVNKVMNNHLLIFFKTISFST